MNKKKIHNLQFQITKKINVLTIALRGIFNNNAIGLPYEKNFKYYCIYLSSKHNQGIVD